VPPGIENRNPIPSLGSRRVVKYLQDGGVLCLVDLNRVCPVSDNAKQCPH
jgi:hypothetical protein